MRPPDFLFVVAYRVRGVVAAIFLAAVCTGSAQTESLSGTAKWLAGLEPQWQAIYQRDVAGPFETGTTDLKKQYLSALERQLTSATQAAKLEDAVAFRGERERLTAGGDVPAEDEALAPEALKQVRAAYRKSFAKLDEDRYARAKVLHARYDAALAQNQAALTQRQRLDEALEIKARRDELAAVWLKPPAGGLPSASKVPTAAATSPPKGPMGQTMAPPPGQKLSKRALVEKLLALGAMVKTPDAELKSLAGLNGEKFIIQSVAINRRADGREWTEEELAIIDQLDEVKELQIINVAATDATIQRLRLCRGLQVLQLSHLAKITGQTFDGIAGLPELRKLVLQNLPKVGDEGCKRLGTMRRVSNLYLEGLAITDAGFAFFTAWPSLSELVMYSMPNTTPDAWRAIPAARKLTSLSLQNTDINADSLVNIAKCVDLEALYLGGMFADPDLAPLIALTKLRSFHMAASRVTGAAFATWPVRPALTGLILSEKTPASENAVRGIVAAFPRLGALTFSTPPGGLATADAAHLSRLRSLRTLHLLGEGLDDAALAELVKGDALETLGLARARLTDAGAASLAKLDKLVDLTLLSPPTTDAALKSYGKLRALKYFRLAPDTPPEVEKKLKAALPNVSVTR